MKIENIDRVATLKISREAAIALHDAARDGTIDGLSIWKDGQRFLVFPALPTEPIRSAIVETASDEIVAINKELAGLGVATPLFEKAEMDAAGWRRTCEMYLRAWLRELGGRLAPKRHLIDALVVTTEQMRRRAEAAAALLAALKPFADIADLYDAREDDDFQLWKDSHEAETRLTLGQCRKARAAAAALRA